MSKLREAVDKMISKGGKCWEHCREETGSFILDICEHYAENLNIPAETIFNALENRRGYSYPNYYQKANFPRFDDPNVVVFDTKRQAENTIQASKGFVCPACNHKSENPYMCLSGFENREGKVCDWSAGGLFGTLGKGYRFMVKQDFVKNPGVENIFMPIAILEKQPEILDSIIDKLFTERWTKDLRDAPIEKKRAQLYKNLKDQTNGYWSGHSAYHLMIDGGFLVDGPAQRDCPKKLTELGSIFMSQMERDS